MSAAIMILAVAVVAMLGMFIGRGIVVAELERRVAVLESEEVRVRERLRTHRDRIADVVDKADAIDCRLNEERDLSTARYHRLRKRIQRVERADHVARLLHIEPSERQ